MEMHSHIQNITEKDASLQVLIKIILGVVHCTCFTMEGPRGSNQHQDPRRLDMEYSQVKRPYISQCAYHPNTIPFLESARLVVWY